MLMIEASAGMGTLRWMLLGGLWNSRAVGASNEYGR
jgi:hypothetical protein